MSKKEYDSLLSLNDSNALLQYALKLRSKALYSEYQMREKLYKKDAKKSDVDKVIKLLKEYDLINDSAYAEELMEYYNTLNYGKNKIIHKLSDKGIFDKEINKLKFPVSKERSKAKSLLPKFEKKYEKYNCKQKKAHIYNAYLEYGFDIELASEMSNNIKEASSKDELKKLEIDASKARLRLARKYKGREVIKQKMIQSLLQKGYKMSDILKVVK